MQLVELSENLRAARRFDVGKLFTTVGYLLFGAALGAAVSGQEVDNKWVMLSGGVGFVCLLAGAALWVERTNTLASINQDLDVHLRTVEDQAAIDRLRTICRESDDRFAVRVGRKWRAWRTKGQA